MSNCSCKGLLKDGNFCECANIDIPLEPTSLLYRDTERDINSITDKCRIIFKNDKKSQWKFSLISAVIFLIISSPFMYNITQSILCMLITISVKGCPTMLGLLLHTTVFLLISYGVMQLDL
jgi:hypothetical protein